MLTILTTPRPLLNEKNRTAFLNAIRSWRQLSPPPEIFVFSRDHQSLVEREGGQFIKDYKGSHDRPYFDSFLSISQLCAANDTLMYCTDHLILTSDLIPAIATTIRKFPDQFILIGQRWQLHVQEPIDFTNSNWETNLHQRTLLTNSPGGPAAKDFIIFRRPLKLKVPPFIMGYPWYDTWLVDAATKAGYPIVDASRVLMTVHQSHTFPEGSAAARELTAGAKRNLKIAKSFKLHGKGSITSTPYVLTRQGVIVRNTIEVDDDFRQTYLIEQATSWIK